jgi:hypothetical protein
MRQTIHCLHSKNFLSLGGGVFSFPQPGTQKGKNFKTPGIYFGTFFAMHFLDVGMTSDWCMN